MNTLEVTRDEGIVTVTMNRPDKLNAATAEMWAELRDTFAAIGRSTDDRCVVLTGAGGNFCAGADLAGKINAPPRHQIWTMRDIGETILALHALPQPCIAKVAGVAVGAGWGLALGCDLVVATADARFSLIFAQRGLSLDGGTSWVVPRLVGLHRAKELALLAEFIDATEAHAMGLVNKVVPADELDAAVDDWAQRLATGPTIALSQTKRLLTNAFQVTLDQAIEDEGRSQSVNFSTKDTHEAIYAWREKRDPQFKGF